MNRFYDNILGNGYETRMLSKRSPQALFMLLLIYVFLSRHVARRCFRERG